MNDKQWLDKVSFAFYVYSKNNGHDKSIDDFIDWLYKQYGIIRSTTNR